MKKKKRKKLRDKFTDALGEEMSARNLNDKIKPASQETDTVKVDSSVKIESKENTLQENTQPSNEVETVEVKENVEIEEIKKPPEVTAEVIKVNIDSEFDKRVFAEADNNFLDEIPKKPRRRLATEESQAARSAFRAKRVRETVTEEKESYFENKKLSDKDSYLHRKLTHAETAGAVLATVMLVYALYAKDKPLFFMAMSLLSHLLRPLIGSFFGKHNREIQNALHGFSIVLFFGALIFLFV